jgi:hypothetical protein
VTRIDSAFGQDSISLSLKTQNLGQMTRIDSDDLPARHGGGTAVRDSDRLGLNDILFSFPKRCSKLVQMTRIDSDDLKCRQLGRRGNLRLTRIDSDRRPGKDGGGQCRPG